VHQQGCAGGRSKKKQGGQLDWDRLAIVLGRHWAYITPEYLFDEMTMKQVSFCMSLLPKEYSDVVMVGRKQDLSWIEKNRIGKVIRPHAK